MWTAEESGYLQARHREAEDSVTGREGEGSVVESKNAVFQEGGRETLFIEY